jgi:predicted DNA-binding protein with PD1-like motif
MKTMEEIVNRAFTPGRRLVGRLPHGQDLIKTIERFCLFNEVHMAAIAVNGAISSVTLGTFDQQQQVYVTTVIDKPLSFAACQGNVSIKDNRPFVHISAVLSDTDGRVTGGRLFSDTIIFAGEIDLQELTGPPLTRQYDATTGLMLWNPAG